MPLWQRRSRVSPTLNPGYSSKERMRSSKITIENPPIYGGELHEVRSRNAFIDLMHGGVDEAEFHDRAIIPDEAGVRRSTRRRKLRPTAGDLGNCTAHQIDERAGFGEKNLSV